MTAALVAQALDGGSPTIVPLVVVGILITALGLFLLVALALQKTGSPEDVAVAYELAWDRLDFERLWELSGDGLRDGRTREVFLADKQAAYAGEAPGLTGLVRRATVESLEVDKGHAIARTELDLADDTTFRNELTSSATGATGRSRSTGSTGERCRGPDVAAAPPRPRRRVRPAPGGRPPPPAGDVHGHRGPGGGSLRCCGYLSANSERALRSSSVPSTRTRPPPGEAHPPELRPVLVPVVDDERRRRVVRQVDDALQRQRPLGLAVDDPVPTVDLAVQGEAARDQVHGSVGVERRHPADPGRGHAGPHGGRGTAGRRARVRPWGTPRIGRGPVGAGIR